MTLGLFDLDNTLIDRRAIFARWASGMMERLGCVDSSGPDGPDGPGAAERLAWLIEVDGNGYGDKARWVPLAAERLGVSEAAIAADRAANWVASIEVDPTVGPALDRLIEAGWTLGMVTNGPPSQWEKIEAASLAGYFDAVVVSELVGVAKPEPAIFELAAEMCGQPLEGWMVGDHPHFDVEGGRSVGLSGAWMPGPEKWPEQLTPPALIVDSIESFVNAVLG